VIVLGARAAPVHHVVAGAAPASGHAAPLAVLLAFPVGMALATGVEAPSSAIAQLGQLDDAAGCGSAAPRCGSWWPLWSG
jgi:hypothetical protein